MDWKKKLEQMTTDPAGYVKEQKQQTTPAAPAPQQKTAKVSAPYKQPVPSFAEIAAGASKKPAEKKPYKKNGQTPYKKTPTFDFSKVYAENKGEADRKAYFKSYFGEKNRLKELTDKAAPKLRAEKKEAEAKRKAQNEREFSHSKTSYKGKSEVENLLKNPASAMSDKGTDFYNNFQLRSSLDKSVPDWEVMSALSSGEAKRPIFIKKPDFKDGNTDYITKGIDSGLGTLDKPSDGLKDNVYFTHRDSFNPWGYNKGRTVTVSLDGDKLKPQAYMTTEEQASYYYLLGKYGTEAAENYLGALMPKLREKARTGYVADKFEKLGKENPIASNANILMYNLSAADEAFRAFIDPVLAGPDTDKDIDDYYYGAAISSISQGQQNSTDNWLAKQGLMLLNGLAQNSLEMALNVIPGVGTGIGAVFGGFQNAGVDRGRMYIDGTIDSKGAAASLVTSWIIGAVPMGKVGELGGNALVKALGKHGIKSGIKSFGINLVGRAAAGAGAGISTAFLQNAADNFFMRENSPFERSVKAYMSYGLSETEARKKATIDTANQLISAMFVGGIQSTIMGLPAARRQGVEFNKRGEKILREQGGIERVLNKADSASETSEAYINAQRLRDRIKKGKEIFADQIGAQDFLNEIEARRQESYMAGITDITGIRFSRGGADDDVNATHEDGSITLSLNPDTDLIEVVKHDTAHAVEAANPDDFSSYRKRLRNAPGYEAAARHLKKMRDDVGKASDERTLESEVAAEFARNFVKGTSDIDRLRRVVNGNPSLSDRIYTGIRDLRARMKAKRKTKFRDDVTGIEISYTELLALEKLYESMLINTHDSFFEPSSPMHSVKQNNDAAKWGVPIRSELDDYSRGRMSKLWQQNKSDVKELIRDAYRQYKAGDTELGDATLREAGALWSASLKKGGTKADIDAFTQKFKKLYDDGAVFKSTIARRAQNTQDKADYNISIGSYVKSILKEIGIKGDRTNETEEAIIRDAFNEIKAGNEQGARETIFALARELFKKAEQGLSDRDKELINYIRNSHLRLSRADGGEEIETLRRITFGTYDENSNNRTADQLLIEAKELFPEFPWAKDSDTAESPAEEILRVYDTVQSGATKPRYSETDIENGARYIADKAIKDFHEATPALKETPAHIKAADEARYGMDIEGSIRSLEIPGMRESDIAELSHAVRTVIDETMSAVQRQIDSLDFGDIAFRDFEKLYIDTLNAQSKRLRDEGYGASDTVDAVSAISDVIFAIINKRLYDYEHKANDLLANTMGDTPGNKKPFDMNARKKESDAETARAQIDFVRETKKKLSRVFTNTAQKDFFEGVDAQLKTEADFVYDAVSNKDTAEAAIEYVKQNGLDAVFRELSTLSGGVTALDTAKAWALAAEYRRLARESEGEERTRYNRAMVDVLNMMQEHWTNAAQAVQAIRMFDMLTLEGQLLYLKRRADSLPESEMKKRPNYEQLKREEAEAKRKDRERRLKEEAEETEADAEPEESAEEASDTAKPKKGKKEKKKEGTPQSELEKFYKKHNIKYISEAEWEYMRERLSELDELDSAHNVNEVIALILKLSKKRKTNATRFVKSLLVNDYRYKASLDMPKGSKLKKGENPPTGGVNETKSFEVLVNTARNQIFAMIGDRMPKGIGRKLGAHQSMSMLNNMRTFLRNVTSNAVFTPGETLVNNLALLTEIPMSLVTKQRGIGFEIPFSGWAGGFHRMREAAIEQSLKVNTYIDSSNGYQDTQNRVFTSWRFFTALEELTGYNLTVSDEFQKGFIQSQVARSLENFVKKGKLTIEDAAEIVAHEMKYRTFQDETVLGELLAGLKEGLNKIGGPEFGLGDFIVKFTRTPGAVVTRNLEYSPAGYIKWIYTVAKTIKDTASQKRKITPFEQRQLSLTFWRPTTSLGLITAGAALRYKGILVGSDITEEDEKDSKMNKFYQALGIKGFKLNLSALGRLINGGDSQFQNGDKLCDISWLTYMPQVLVGAAIQDRTGEELDREGIKNMLLEATFSFEGLKNTVDYTVLQLTGLPAFTGIRDFVNNWTYSEGPVEFMAQTVADGIMSFVPQAVKQATNVIDTRTRDPYHPEHWLDGVLQKAMSQIPWLSKSVPQKVDIFGEPMSGTLGSKWADILNNMVSPGRIDVYKANAVINELEALREYNSGVIPKTPKQDNSIVIDEKTCKFKLGGADYEEYSKWLGTTTMANIAAFMSSEYYEYLPMYQRADAVAKIIDESDKACKKAWVYKLDGAGKAAQSEVLTNPLEESKAMAEELVYQNQAKEYVKSGKVNVEDVANCYIEKPYTQAEAQSAIAKRKRGNYTENEQKQVANILSGKSKKKHYIKGKWSELTEEQQEKVLWYIENYSEYVTLPDEQMKKENLKNLTDLDAPEKDIIDFSAGERLNGDYGSDTANETSVSSAGTVLASGKSAAGSKRSGGSRGTSKSNSFTLSLPSREFTARDGITLNRIYNAFKNLRGFTARSGSFKRPTFNMAKAFENHNKPKFVMPFNKA